MNLLEFHPKATPQHRLGGYALDIALFISTCCIGWFIWSLVIWSQGLTPGKQILKLKVVSSITGAPAKWGHMAIRQLLIPLTFSLPFSIFSAAFDPYFFDSYYWEDSYFYEGIFYSNAMVLLTNLLALAVLLFDALWIFHKGQSRRITDVWAKTDVINQADIINRPI